MLEEPSTLSADIKAERDYMDTVCRSFANRLERRRTLLITSVRFHRLAEDVSQGKAMRLWATSLVIARSPVLEPVMGDFSNDRSPAFQPVMGDFSNDRSPVFELVMGDFSNDRSPVF